MIKSLVLKESLGIDVSKDTLSFCLGRVLSTMEKEFAVGKDITNDKSGFKKLVSWLKKESKHKDCPTIVMEATGVYHEAVAHYLHSLGYKVCIMQSGRVKRYAQSLDQKSKTDALDSRMLAMLGCERTLKAWDPPSPTLQELRALSRERSSLVRDKIGLKNRFDAFERGAYDDKRIVRRFKKRIQLLEQQIADIEQEMHELVESDKQLSRGMSYIQSIPGVSFISVATVVGETLGFATVENGKQLTSYVGYDVVIRDSGSFKGKQRISKKGNKNIRAILHMPSMAAVRVNPTLKPFYERLKPNKIKPIIALVAVQRKLLILMYTLWKNEEFYDMDFEQKKRQDLKDLVAQDSDEINSIAS